jgi:spoIIIJ-associated protein
MKDQVFSGRDVGEALLAAARALGLPPAALRYVVLDAGAPSAGASRERMAQVAVLLDRGGSERPVPSAPVASRPPGDPLGRLRALIRAAMEAADLDAEVEVEGGDHAPSVRIRGAGSGFFLGQQGEVLRALQHLLQRALGHEWPGKILLECEGYKELRDAGLRTQALEAAAAVRGDGQPRLLGPLNSYERRIVHVALADAPGIRTFSVGEGSDRRVTVAPAEPGSNGV